MPVNITGKYQDTLSPGYVERHAARARATEEEPVGFRAARRALADAALRQRLAQRASAEAEHAPGSIEITERVAAERGMVVATHAYAHALLAAGGEIAYRGHKISDETSMAPKGEPIRWEHDSWEPGDKRAGWSASLEEALDAIDEATAK